MARRATVYDVAERAGVSIATVSFAFRQPDRVRERTREAVYAAARDLGYAPRASARQLAHENEGPLGLYAFDMALPSDLSTPDLSLDELLTRELATELRLDRFPLYVDEIQHGFQLESMRRGRNVLIGAGRSDTYVSTMDIAGSVDGLAIYPGSTTSDVVSSLAKRVPVVAFSQSVEGTGHSIRVDNGAAIASLVEHLVSVHELREIAFVGGFEAPDIVDRFAAFQGVCHRLRLPVPAEPFDDSRLGDPPLRGLSQALDSNALPGALLCATDQLAIAAIELLSARGVRTPQDVVVTGFDGIAAGTASSPTLTTVRQPFVSMGRLAVRVLLGDPAANATHSHVLATRLAVRQSCGCVPL